MRDKHIVCFHLYNDYSGSPKVLKMVLQDLLNDGYKVDLVSSRGGVLDELIGTNGFRKHSYFYRFSPNPAITMLRFLWVQIYTFFLAFRYVLDENVVFYINTLLPVGPALAGRLMGKKVVYHYHENAFVKGGVYRLLANEMQKLASRIICVSEYQASFLKAQNKVSVIPNALPIDFLKCLIPDSLQAFQRKEILMLGSLKLYKSPLEFIQLAQQLGLFPFTMVVNDSQENIDKFLEEHRIRVPANLKIYSRQKNVASFYNSASLVLNLSDKNKVLETFGLTALEAMSAGLPVIVPTEGGIAELVDDGVKGYNIDVQDLDLIEEKIKDILTDGNLYKKLSKGALKTASKYSEEAMIKGIIEIFKAQL